MDWNSPQHQLLRFFQGNRTTVLVRAGVLIGVIAVIDWHYDVNVAFGFLYLFPMLMAGGCLTRPQIAAVAALCTGLNEAFDPFHWSLALGASRLILTFAAFFGAGLFVFESARNRRLAGQHLAEVEKEVELRREAEAQLRILIESSPASIFTLDGDGRVLIANEAAHRLLGLEKGKLEGAEIAPHFPVLANVLLLTDGASFMRTAMECHGKRQDGEVFQAQVWFSTYQTAAGPRLAAVVFDTSEELRDREEFSLQQLLAGSKVLVSAVCHEVGNICGAIASVHAKLARNERLFRDEDFRALGTLVEGLGQMAALELRQAKPEVENLDIRSTLEELRIIIEPSFRESGVSINWDVPESVPPVRAERQALLQAFLNLTKNSHRAMEGREKRELVVRASLEGDSVVIRFIDTGHGVAAPQHLFKPFQPGADANGLGLYLSRAFVRAFQGDIEYEPRSTGCCFRVVLIAAKMKTERSRRENGGENSAAAVGRSQPLSREPQQAPRL